MDLNEEKNLLDLARRLKDIDREINKQREEKGNEDGELREQYYEVKEKIEKILATSLPLDDIRDPLVRDTLRRVRDSDFLLDRESKELMDNLRKLPPEILESFLKRKGITVSEEEVDEEIARMNFQFDIEITEEIEPFDYLERKKEFSTIIADTRLPQKIHKYFGDIRKCFLFGQMYAVMGLCRVILEIAFKDKFRKLRLNKFESSKVHSMDDYRIPQIIREVCVQLNRKSLSNLALELYRESSHILHGRESEVKLEETEVLDFVRKTFKVIEQLYA